MSKRDLFIFLFKWKVLIASMFLVCLGTAVALICFGAPGYTAKATVLVERNRPPVMRAMPEASMDLAEALNTEIEIMLSRGVLERVVDTLKPHERPRKPSLIGDAVKSLTTWMEDVGLLYPQAPRERWIDQLKRNLKVKASIDASILRLSLGDTDPGWAAQLINAVIKEYLAEHVRAFSSRDTAGIFGERLDAIQREMRGRRDELARLKQQQSVAAIEETKRDLVRRIGDSGVLQETARGEIETLLLRFEPGHREVQLARARLARQQVAEAQMRERLTRLEAQAAKLDELVLQISSLETAYRDYSRRHDEARLTDVASANATNVVAIDMARVPDKPGTSRLLLLLISFGASLLLALLSAAVLEYFDRRMASPQDAQDILDLPDLGSVRMLSRRERTNALRGPGVA